MIVANGLGDTKTICTEVRAVPKEIILYNLKITDDQYMDYLERVKGPLMDSLPSCDKFELVRIKGAVSGEIPFTYVGIMHLNSLKDFYERDAASEPFQNFLKEWREDMAAEPWHILYGDEVWPKK